MAHKSIPWKRLATAAVLQFHPLSLAVGIVAGMVLAAVALDSIRLREWQTLVSGMLALVAAFGTVAVVLRQLAARHQEVQEQRRRKLLAARAVLPADLSAICGYVEECTRQVETALVHHRNGRGDQPPAFACPSLPERVLANLQDLVEHLDEADAEAVADLLACYQVQHARLQGEISWWNNSTRGGSTRVTSEYNIESTMGETVRLYLLTTNMFPFARREVEGLPAAEFSEDTVKSTLRILEIGDVLSAKYQETLVALHSTN